MFTGVVVESFAYVYQMPGGASLDRDQMSEQSMSVTAGCSAEHEGAFKRVWSEFDIRRSGYLRRKDLVPFFAVSMLRFVPHDRAEYLASSRGF